MVTTSEQARIEARYNTQLKKTQGVWGKKKILEFRGVERGVEIKDENLRFGFTQIPNVILRDGKLSGNEKVLYMLLLSYAWQEGGCWPGQERVSGELGVTKKTLLRLLGKLRKAKLISWKRRGLGLTNVYYIERLAEYFGQKQCIDKP